MTLSASGYRPACLWCCCDYPPGSWREPPSSRVSRSVNSRRLSARVSPSAAWLPGCRVRFCPACLAGTGGRWQLAWRATVTAVCATHRLLLHDRCPSCGAFPRVRMTGPPSPLHCTSRLHYGSRCGADLTLASPTPAPTAAGGEQVWAATLLAAASDHKVAAAVLAEVPAVLSWVERMHEAAGATAQVDRGRYRSAAATAHLLPDVASILGADTSSAIARIQALISAAADPVTVTPRGLTGPRFADLPGPFGGRYRRAVDSHLDATDRLRHRSTTPAARAPAGVPAGRVRSIPELLWPDWYARLRPVADLRGDRARATYSNALLVPGLTDRQLRPSLATLNSHRSPNALSTVLRAYPADTQTTVLQMLTRLVTTWTPPGPDRLPASPRDVRGPCAARWPQWQAVAVDADTHPRRRAGGGTNDPSPPGPCPPVPAGPAVRDRPDQAPAPRPAYDTPADRARYHAFADAITPRLRAGLRRHAQELLTQPGIAEPLTWSPPAGVADGLDPARDPSSRAGPGSCHGRDPPRSQHQRRRRPARSARRPRAPGHRNPRPARGVTQRHGHRQAAQPRPRAGSVASSSVLERRLPA